MIATFHRLYPEAALPKRKVDLYREICALQLVARPRDRRIETVLLELEAEPVLGKVALSMMQQTLKRIEADALLKEIETALAEQDEATDARTFLEDVVRISELIVQQEDEYEFAHLSFQEYLAAAYIAASLLMITEVGKERGQSFESKDLMNFPCEPLRTIDGLWVKHSQGKFGFSVQKSIYMEKCDGVPNGQYDGIASDNFCRIVKWNQTIFYDFVSIFAAPEGHLPHSFLGDSPFHSSLNPSDFFSRIQTCEL